jgi:hypothetical protein
MQAVGIEGGIFGFRGVVASHREPDLAPAMAQHQLATRMQRWHGDDERREHARRFLGVAVADEETALVVDQQLVQLSRHTGTCAQPGGRTLDDACQHLRPMFARDVHPTGTDLPGPPHGGVDQSFAAAAIGCTLGRRNELRGLHRQQRQGDRPDAVNLDQRQVHRATARGVEVTRRLHGLQKIGQRVVDRFHAGFVHVSGATNCAGRGRSAKVPGREHGCEHAARPAGCVGITPFGTTGECSSFTVAERRAAIDGLVARGIPAKRVIAEGQTLSAARTPSPKPRASARPATGHRRAHG